MVNLFKDRLREIREEKGITQKVLADALKTFQSNIADWESGKNTPNMFSIIQLAEYLNVTAGQLLGLEPY